MPDREMLTSFDLRRVIDKLIADRKEILLMEDPYATVRWGLGCCAAAVWFRRVPLRCYACRAVACNRELESARFCSVLVDHVCLCVLLPCPRSTIRNRSARPALPTVIASTSPRIA